MPIVYQTNPTDPEYRDGVADLWRRWYGGSGESADVIRRSVDTICNLGAKYWLPQLVVAVDDYDDVVGTGAVTSVDTVYGKPLYPVVTQLYVDPECRGHGIAREIVLRLAKYIFDNEWHEHPVAPVDHIYLCTDVSNFYEKLGFRRLKTDFAYWALRIGHPDEPYVYHLTRSTYESMKSGDVPK